MKVLCVLSLGALFGRNMGKSIMFVLARGAVLCEYRSSC